MQRQYWRFYWPLALTALAMLLAKQFQNGVLARYPDAVRELATFAFAASVFFFLNAALVFVPQMVNVLARSRPAHRVCLRFTMGACLILTAPLAGLAFSPLGGRLVAWVFDIRGETLAAVVRYLRYLSPLLLINGLRQYYTGMLIQARYTVTVTILNGIFVAVMLALLVGGLNAGWPAVTTLAVAQVVSAAVHLAASWAVFALRHRFPDGEEPERLTYGQVLVFFWPVATTSTMFALSRPIIYAFVSRTPHSVVSVAALRVGFDFAMIFHAPLNQFRHLMVTFGRDDPDGPRRFMIRMMVAVTVVMVLVAATPLSTLVFRGLLRVPETVLPMARHVLAVLCVIPLIVTTRNYFHGRLLVDRRTSGMAAGGVCRVVAIAAASWGLHAAGLLSHAAAAGILMLGFAAETVVAAAFSLLRTGAGAADLAAAETAGADAE